MKQEWVLVLLVSVLTFLLLSVTSLDSHGAVRYTKETGKKCVFCHTEVPEPGDQDPKLNSELKKRPRMTGWPKGRVQARRRAWFDALHPPSCSDPRFGAVSYRLFWVG